MLISPALLQLPELHYRLARLARGLRPGMHRGRDHGDGLEPVAHVELLHGRDPRRLDLRASARDPLRRLLLRNARPRISIPVYLIADLSASMGAAGAGVRLALVADLTAALAWSVARSGDTFVFFGCDERVRPEFTHVPGRGRARGLEIAGRVRAFEPRGAGIAGMLAATSRVHGADALVFIASDFHFPLEQVDALLAPLDRVYAVPVVVEDSREALSSARGSIARLRDAEDARERTVVLTRGMRERLRLHAERRRHLLAAVFRRHGTAGLWLTDRFDPDRVTRHFHA